MPIVYSSVTGKVRNLQKSKLILGNFGVHHPHIVRILILHAGGRAESALLLSFLCKVLRRKDSLPFPREKIDSGVLWHNFGIFTHTEVRVFFFFFFLNKVIYKNKLQLAHTGVCTKLNEIHINSQCTIVQFNNKHILEHVQS